MQNEDMQIKIAATLTFLLLLWPLGNVMQQKKDFSQTLERTAVPPQSCKCSLFLWIEWAFFLDNAMLLKSLEQRLHFIWLANFREKCTFTNEEHLFVFLKDVKYWWIIWVFLATKCTGQDFFCAAYSKSRKWMFTIELYILSAHRNIWWKYANSKAFVFWR